MLEVEMERTTNHLPSDLSKQRISNKYILFYRSVTHRTPPAFCTEDFHLSGLSAPLRGINYIDQPRA